MVNYQLKCKDIGFNSCDFVSAGNSDSEIMRRFYFHTLINHEKEFKQMPEEKKMELHNIIRRILNDQNYN